jgi:hypothetical protein
MWLPPRRLVVMAALLLATRGDTLGDEALHSVATALTTDELRACDHIGVRRQLHSCVANLVAAVGPRCAAVSKLLFLSLLQLKAAGEPGLQDLVSVRNPSPHSSVCMGSLIWQAPTESRRAQPWRSLYADLRS